MTTPVLLSALTVGLCYFSARRRRTRVSWGGVAQAARHEPRGEPCSSFRFFFSSFQKLPVEPAARVEGGSFGEELPAAPSRRHTLDGDMDEELPAAPSRVVAGGDFDVD